MLECLPTIITRLQVAAASTVSGNVAQEYPIASFFCDAQLQEHSTATLNSTVFLQLDAPLPGAMAWDAQLQHSFLSVVGTVCGQLLAGPAC